MEPVVNINLNKKAVIKDIAGLTSDPNISKVYANGFQIGLTLGDASLVVKHNEVATHVITMSLPALKSLYEQLGKIISIHGSDTGLNILSFEEMTAVLKKKQADGKL